MFGTQLERHGEDLLSVLIPIVYEKVATYNLRYRSRDGALRPVRFGSYIWKRFAGMAIDYLKRERRACVVPYEDARSYRRSCGEGP